MASLPCQMPEPDSVVDGGVDVEGPQTRAHTWASMRPQGLFVPLGQAKHGHLATAAAASAVGEGESEEYCKERSHSEELFASPDIRSGCGSPHKSSWSNGVFVKNTFIDICPDESDRESSTNASPRRRNYSAPPSPSRVRGHGDDVTGFEGLEENDEEGSVGGSSSGRKDGQRDYSPWRSTKLGSPKKIQIFQDLMTDGFHLSPGFSGPGSCESAGNSSDAPRRLAPKLGEFHKVVATPPLSARSEAFSTSADFPQAIKDCGSGSFSTNTNANTNNFNYESSNSYSHSYSLNYSNPCAGSVGSAGNLNGDVEGFDDGTREDLSTTPPGSAGFYFASDVVLRHQPQPSMMQGLPNMLTPPPMVCGEVKSVDPQALFKQAFDNLEDSRRPTPPPGTWGSMQQGHQQGSSENLQPPMQAASMLPPASNMCQPAQQSLQMRQQPQPQQQQPGMLPPPPSTAAPGPELWNSGPSRLEELRSRGRQAQDKLRVTKTSSKREPQPPNRTGASANNNTNPSSMSSTSSSFQSAASVLSSGNQHMAGRNDGIPSSSGYGDSHPAQRRQPLNGSSPLPVGRVAGLVGGVPPGAFGAPSNCSSSNGVKSGSMLTAPPGVLPPATAVNSAATTVASMPPHFFAAVANGPQGRAAVAPR